MKINAKQWAPRCCMTQCNNQVDYHKRFRKMDGTVGFRWKTMCEDHRTVKKSETDQFKMSRGCENKDARHGFACTAMITSAAQLDIHHRDGNRHNNLASNLECLCRNCHQVVTLNNGDHLNRYTNTVKEFDTWFQAS